MSQQDLQEYHLLYIRDLAGERTVTLDAATYAVGRDSRNALVVYDPMVSRSHCLLVRLPLNQTQYVYRIVDGGISGKPSTNGVRVNSRQYQEKVLETRDYIQLGNHVSLDYLVATMTPSDFAQNFSDLSLPFQSVQDEIMDPTGTMVEHIFA